MGIYLKLYYRETVSLNVPLKVQFLNDGSFLMMTVSKIMLPFVIEPPLNINEQP